MKNKNVINFYMYRRGIVRSARVCPRCGGEGTFLSGETCYYCQGKGTVD